VGKFLRAIGRVVQGALKWAKSNPALVGVGFLALVLGLVISGVIPIRQASGSTHARKPYEYLYLDPARVGTYLGQLDDGEINQETRADTLKESGGTKLEVKELGELNGTLSDERTASAVVSFSEADNFFKLETTLQSEGTLDTIALNSCCRAAVREELAANVSRLEAQRSGASHAQLEQRSREQLEAESEGKLEHLTLGTIVKLEGVFLHVPPYMAAYPSLRYAPFRDTDSRVLGPARSSPLSETEVTSGQHVSNERKRFIKDAGPNPRVPFSTELPGLKVVIPARFDYLTGDPSLLATDVTVVGKVVFTGKDYGDAASEATYLPPLLNAKRDFLADLGFRKSFLAKYPPHRRRALDTKLFQALQHSLIFKGASVEIIPIAIYN
jgi:hypothetical protein